MTSTTDSSLHPRDVRTYRWTYFQIPSRDRVNQPRPYDMFTYRKVNSEGTPIGDILFFGNCIAYLLGHDSPHKTIDNLPDEYKTTIPEFSGYFLNESVVRSLAYNDQWVLDWLDSYVNRCNAVNPAVQNAFTPIEEKDIECPF